MKRPLLERVDERRDKSGGPDACWPRTWGADTMGIGDKGKQNVEVRRVAWFLEHGEWPPREIRLHMTCRNAKCLNPKHFIVDPAGRFWRWVQKAGPTECWLWTGSFGRRGYGEFSDRSQRKNNIRAHRYAYELTHGPITDPELVVMHLCDNPPCCNPAHLKVGTYKDNTADMIAKGRHPVICAARGRVPVLAKVTPR